MRPDIRVAADILLTPVRLEHAPSYAALVDEDRRRLSRWLAWADASRTVDDVRRFIADVDRRRADDLGENYVVLVDGVLAGSLDVHDVNRQHAVGALGYWLGARFGGRGVMARSVRALAERVFADQRLHRLEILAATENVASRRVAERAGFALEAVLRERLCAPAGFDDCALYVRFAPSRANRCGVVGIKRLPGGPMSP